MSKKGENIYKRKDGRWEGRFIKERIGSRCKYGYVYAHTYQEAKEKLIVAIYSYKSVQESYANNTFKLWSQKWLASIETQLKHSTIMKYNNSLNLYLLPHIGEMGITQISYKDIDRLSNILLSSGGKNNGSLSPRTVSSSLSIVKNVLNYASRCENLSLINIKHISIKQTHKNMRIFSRIEQEKLSNSLLNNLDETNIGILLCLYTGIRIGELCALKWEDVSFDDHCIQIHKTMQRVQVKDSNTKTDVIITEPKSNCSIRKIPLPNDLYTILINHRAEDHTFILSSSSSFVEPRTMQNRFKCILDKCSIAPANFHALRHTFATRCIELGFDIKSLSEILGHASVNITLNRYVHPSMELKQKNMEMLDSLLTVS